MPLVTSLHCNLICGFLYHYVALLINYLFFITVQIQNNLSCLCSFAYILVRSIAIWFMLCNVSAIQLLIISTNYAIRHIVSLYRITYGIDIKPRSYLTVYWNRNYTVNISLQSIMKIFYNVGTTLTTSVTLLHKCEILLRYEYTYRTDTRWFFGQSFKNGLRIFSSHTYVSHWLSFTKVVFDQNCH